jgi:cob(I)alamin adenosyltransferase
MKNGLLIVNTGDGKGKTTAALGTAMRTAGHGLKVCFIQFIKGSWTYGELDAVKSFPDTIDFHVMGKGFTWNSDNVEEDKALAQKGWQLATQAIASTTYHLVVLDEFTYLLNYGMIDLSSAVETLTTRPSNLHVIVTGRDAPTTLVDAADLVTEMREIKHPFKKGIKAQKGIEF